MADRETRVKLGYTVDNSSVASAVNANAKVAASYESVSAAASKFSPAVLALNPQLAQLAANEQTAAAATQRLAQTQILAANSTAQHASALAQQRAPLQDLTALYAALEQQELKAAAAGAAVANTSARNKVGDLSTGFGTLRAAGSAFGNLGGGQGLTQIASFVGLTAQLGALGAAIGAAAIVMRALTEETNRITAATKARLANEADLRKALEDATLGEAIRQRDQAEKDRARAQENLTAAQDARVTLNADAILGLFTRGIVGGGELEGNAQAAAAAQIALTGATTALEFWNTVIDENSTEVADAAAARIRLMEAELARVNLSADVDKLTADQRAERAASDLHQIAVLDDLIQNSDLSADAQEQLSIQAQALRLDYEAVTAATSTYADVLAREAEARRASLATVTDSIAYRQKLDEQIRTSTVEQVADRLHALQEENRALETFLPQLQELAPTSKEAAKALEEAQTRLGQISDDYADLMINVLPAAIARAQADLSADQDAIRAKSQLKLNEIEAARTEAEGKASEARGEAYADSERKRGEALNDLAEKQAAEREKIERKSGVAIANAVYGRNALAAYLALQQKQQDLQDLTERGVERTAEIDKQSRREREQAERNYAKALRNAQEAAEKSGRLERERAIRELNERINAYNQQIGLLDLFNVQGTQQITQFVNNAIAGLRNLANSVGAILSGASGGGIGAAVGGVIGMPPGWVPFPPASGWGIGGAVGGVLSAQRAPTYPIGATSGSRNLTGAPPRGLFPPQISPPTPIYRGAQASQQGAGAGSSYTFNISGSKQDARAIAKQIEPLIRSVTRDEVVEVANTLIGGRR